MGKFGLLNENQFGFQKNRSTEDAILALTSRMYEALDNTKPALCIFLDLAEAFDTVDHAQLLGALQNMGCRGRVHELFSSYISNCQNQ